MSITQAMILGATGNEMSKKLRGSDEVSPERTALAVGSGALVSGGVIIVAGLAPVAIPITVATATISGIMSLFK